MRGYWNDPSRTTETIDSGGWLHSGDIGIMDEDGYVTIVGRSKDMIIRGVKTSTPKKLKNFYIPTQRYRIFKYSVFPMPILAKKFAPGFA